MTGPTDTPRSTAAADFDSPWEEANDAFFRPFMALCFPAVHGLIDWSRPNAFLDAELQRITGDSTIGRRCAAGLRSVLSSLTEPTAIGHLGARVAIENDAACHRLSVLGMLVVPLSSGLRNDSKATGTPLRRVDHRSASTAGEGGGCASPNF